MARLQTTKKVLKLNPPAAAKKLGGLSEETYTWLWSLKQEGRTIEQITTAYNKAHKAVKVNTMKRKMRLIAAEMGPKSSPVKNSDEDSDLEQFLGKVPNQSEVTTETLESRSTSTTSEQSKKKGKMTSSPEIGATLQEELGSSIERSPDEGPVHPRKLRNRKRSAPADESVTESETQSTADDEPPQKKRATQESVRPQAKATSRKPLRSKKAAPRTAKKTQTAESTPETSMNSTSTTPDSPVIDNVNPTIADEAEESNGDNENQESSPASPIIDDITPTITNEVEEATGETDNQGKPAASVPEWSSTFPAKPMYNAQGVRLPFWGWETTYEKFVNAKLRTSMNQHLDLPQHEIISEFRETEQAVDRVLIKEFDHLNDAKFMVLHSQRLARHLMLSLNDVAHLISGIPDADAFEALQTGFRPSVDSQECGDYPGIDIARAIFWGTVTTRVYQKNLLDLLGVPGSHEAGSRAQKDEGAFRNFLASKSDELAAKHRFLYRDFRARYLETPEFATAAANYTEKVFDAYENAACASFQDERLYFEEKEREVLMDAIARAINIKCRADLSHYKCEWRWASINATFEDGWMGPPAQRTVNQKTKKRNVNLVQFGCTPAVITRETDDGNFFGREEWETTRNYVRGNRRQQLEQESSASMEEKEKEKDDGFNGWRKVILEADVCLLEGSLSKAGPKWTGSKPGLGSRTHRDYL